jgi:hypothetical protein
MDMHVHTSVGRPVQGETIVKLVGCGLLFLACTSSAVAGERYIEIWNPPEARGGLLQGTSASKSPAHKRRVPHLVKTRAHRTLGVPAKLAMKPGAANAVTNANAGARRVIPDASEIPRLITPEGNVLRVDARGSRVEVVR